MSYARKLLLEEISSAASALGYNYRAIQKDWKHEFKECWDCDAYFHDEEVYAPHCSICQEEKEYCRTYDIPPDLLERLQYRAIKQMQESAARAWSAAYILLYGTEGRPE